MLLKNGLQQQTEIKKIPLIEIFDYTDQKCVIDRSPKNSWCALLRF